MTTENGGRALPRPELGVSLDKGVKVLQRKLEGIPGNTRETGTEILSKKIWPAKHFICHTISNYRKDVNLISMITYHTVYFYLRLLCGAVPPL